MCSSFVFRLGEREVRPAVDVTLNRNRREMRNLLDDSLILLSMVVDQHALCSVRRT
jgi:hypothetical protein